MQEIFTEVNNGVYRCGSRAPRRPTTPPTTASSPCWTARRTPHRPPLPHGRGDHRGRRAPVLLALVRFDAVYHGHFKCSRTKLTGLCPCCGRMRVTCSRRRGSARRSTSSRSSNYYVVHTDLNYLDRPEGPRPVRLAHPHGREAHGSLSPPGPAAQRSGNRTSPARTPTTHPVRLGGERVDPQPVRQLDGGRLQHRLDQRLAGLCGSARPPHPPRFGHRDRLRGGVNDGRPVSDRVAFSP